MYNFFKYQQTVKQQQDVRKEEQKYSLWLLKHQDIKQQAKQKQKAKLQDWVNTQLKQGVKYHIQDDHYKQWRFIKQFRDVEHQPAFVGYKTFRHKPSHQMNKYFNQRERKQIEYLANKKQHLIDSEKIHQAQRKRSLRSQGPLHPKIQFRSLKKDHEVLNPRMRFHNVTDKQRMHQTKITFDDRFKSVYSSFEMKQSKIGVPKISFYNEKQNNNSRGIRSKSTKDRYDNTIITQKSERITQSRNYPVHFSMIPLNEENLAESKQFSTRLQPVKQLHGIKNNQNRKTYFKLAKTMQLQGNNKIKQLLLKSQYDRKKDLSNLKMNISCQNYYKRPIL